MKKFAPGVSNVLLAAASLALVACGSVVIIEDAPLGSGGGSPTGSGGSVGETGSTGAGETPSIYDDCTIVCAEPSDASNCSCKMFCTDPTFSTPNARISCAPLAKGSTKIQCVCTYGVDFSGVCFEKNNESCDFEFGCCAKYFSGK